MCASTRTKIEFRCPGEPGPISRAVHLARLAAFYPACRRCTHRADTADFSPKLAERLAEAHDALRSFAVFDDEGISGVLLNELTPEVARRAAVAFGLLLRQRHEEPTWPTVVLAGDGRRASAPLLAAAARGLRFAGCHVLDMGQTTSGCLALALHGSAADGGLLVGNPSPAPWRAALRFWQAGRPLSRGMGLQQLETIYGRNLDRPTRQFGSLRRVALEADYLDSLAEYYHALRPLRVVLNTDCRPPLDYVRRLSRSLECHFFHHTSGSGPLAERIGHHEAHFGVAIDGNGETCGVVDESGTPVPEEHLLRLIARHLITSQQEEKDPDNRSEPTIILENETSTQTEDALAQLAYRVVRTDHRRAEMHRAVEHEDALLGGGPSGRLWYRRLGHVSADALVTLSLLLVILSQSDRPFSQVLDEAVGPQ